MHCRSCGHFVKDEDLYCAQCGARILTAKTPLPPRDNLPHDLTEKEEETSTTGNEYRKSSSANTPNSDETKSDKISTHKSAIMLAAWLYIIVLFFSSFHIIGLFAAIPTLGAFIVLRIIKNRIFAYIASLVIFLALHLLCVAMHQTPIKESQNEFPAPSSQPKTGLNSPQPPPYADALLSTPIDQQKFQRIDNPTNQLVKIESITLGNAIDNSLTIKSPLTVFSPHDTVFLVVGTSTPTDKPINGTLRVSWTYNEIVSIHEEETSIQFSGPGLTAFQISKPDGWPNGLYRVQVFLNNNPPQEKIFYVR